MRVKKALLSLSLALGILVAGAGAVSAEPGQGSVRSAGGQPIKGQYIVVFKDDVASASAEGLAMGVGGKVKHTYTKALRGFSAQMSEQAAKKLAKDPAVKFVEQDAIATASATQANPPAWGLDRVDQRNLPLDKSYTYPNTASNVTAYILDSGIRTTHVDFGGRAVNGYDFIDNDPVANDCNGHGTHVAGTVGGTVHGVAKNVKLVGVRVLDCNGTGSYSAIIAGVDWVTDHASGPSVANMSLGGPTSTALNNAVRNSISAGVTYALAAGNNSTNACTKSPASTVEAITVGNADSTDTRWSSSNYGTCLDLFAPGTSILSAYKNSDTSTTKMTGTSMASPHVAGVAALHLSANPALTPAQVRDKIVADSTAGIIKSAGTGSPNRNLFIGGAVQPPQPTNCGPFTNGGDVAIPDLSSVRSYITVAGCTGTASAVSTVAVDIKHTFRGDLKIYIVAPDGTRYRLKDSDLNDGADNVVQTYTVNLSTETRNGEWKLRVDDIAENDEGYIDSWSLSL